ncbi:hypothetical protein TWF730_005486 [Orbilia blumenaviensis]|uniref:DUF1996 domain-containing protein n=1 Tax=Orbilia blumenaviensis TaxID=1796055 RepID=A0AAV9VLD4_9PEZI
MKTVLSLAAFMLLNPGVQAFWRMQCGSPLVTDMIDPLVQPGVSPAKHVHNIMGGDAFDKTTSWDRLQESTCTSCEVKGDKSIYWVPTLYFKKANGEILQVNQKDGMLVYYIPERGGDKVEIFPKGFGMMAGNPKLRAFDESNEPGSEDYMRQMAIGYNCLNYGGTPEAFAARRKMPTKEDMKNCVDGLRADITFPSCWNGELGSEDHRSHMAYPSFMEDGECPDSHPRRLITLKFETLFDVAKFSDVDGEFIWSTGDDSGYSYHGDFFNGWDTELLEAAYKDESCVPPVITSDGGDITKCNTFTSRNQLQGPQEMNSCKIEPITKKTYDGPFEKLPGCNPIGGAAGDCGNIVVENAVAAPSSVVQVIAHEAPKSSKTTPSPTPTPTPTTISTTTKKKEQTSKKVEVAPAPKPEVTANPVLNVGSVPEKKIKEVVVTVVETIYKTVYNQAVETATEYVPHYARHRRFRRGPRHH